MAETALKLTINGIDYTGWETIEITRSVQDLTGAFSIQVVDIQRFEGKPQIRAGDPCKLTIRNTPEEDEQLILTGHIDSVAGNVTGEGISFTINGRDLAADLVDCAVVFPTSWREVTFQ